MEIGATCLTACLAACLAACRRRRIIGVRERRHLLCRSCEPDVRAMQPRVQKVLELNVQLLQFLPGELPFPAAFRRARGVRYGVFI